MKNGTVAQSPEDSNGINLFVYESGIRDYSPEEILVLRGISIQTENYAPHRRLVPDTELVKDANTSLTMARLRRKLHRLSKGRANMIEVVFVSQG
jgi:hypothetical protein